MVSAFDIFKIDGDHHVHWLEAARDLHFAKSRLKASGPGTYIVLNQESGDKFFFDVNSDGMLTLLSDLEQSKIKF